MQLRGRHSTNSEDVIGTHGIDGSVTCNIYTDWRSTLQQSPETKSHKRDSLSSSEKGVNAKEVASGYSSPIREVNNCSKEVLKQNTFPQIISSCESIESNSAADTECVKLSESAKSTARTSREQSHTEKPRKGRGIGKSGNYKLVFMLPCDRLL